MEHIIVPASTPYPVWIGGGLLDTCGPLVRERTGASKCAVIADSNTGPLFGQRLLTALRDAGLSASLSVFPAGESHKTLSTYGDILSFLAREGLTRSDCVLALGGGVTGDLTGFAAATYQRGVDFFQFPTTLLAASDASVGGKTAVDLPQGKNLAGAFWQPRAVFCDTTILSRLPGDLFAQGMAETIKHGLIRDRRFLERLLSEDAHGWLPQVVRRNVELKAQVVAQDEREAGERKKLNFGHTLGHAMEALSGYGLSHGEAVAIGMVLAARAGERLGLSAPGTAQVTAAACRAYGLPTETTCSPEDLCQAAWGDKKRSGDRLDLVVLREVGEAALYRVDRAGLRNFVEAALWT